MGRPVVGSRAVTVDAVRNGRNSRYDSTAEMMRNSGRGGNARAREAESLRAGGLDVRDEREGMLKVRDRINVGDLIEDVSGFGD